MQKSIPKVTWIYTINPGVTYYRMYSFAQRLSEKELVNSMLFPHWDVNRLVSPDWESHMDEYMSTFEDLAKNSDMIIMQYVSTPMGIALVQGMRDLKPTYMEVDDYFSGVPSYSCAYESNQPGDRQDYWATVQMKESTGLVCSTTYLADHGRKYNNNVKVISNCIDFNLWDRNEPRPKNDRVRIGWIGSDTHIGDLKIVKDVLYEVLEKHENAEVMMRIPTSMEWPKHERFIPINAWVTIDKYPELVKSFNFDIGIAPLRDNYFNRSKSNLRMLEYSACKIPTVASNVEPFKHDFTGYTCSTDQEWFDNLSMLIQDASLREQDGLKAYDQVKANFNLDDIAMRYYGLMLEAMGRDNVE